MVEIGIIVVNDTLSRVNFFEKLPKLWVSRVNDLLFLFEFPVRFKLRKDIFCIFRD